MLQTDATLLPDVIAKNMLTMLKGDTWKATRATFTPIFTSGKMKAMVPLINAVSKDLLTSIKSDSSSGDKTDLKETLGKFSMGAIASCAFGLDAKTFGETESPFVRFARTFFITTPLEGLKLLAYMMPGGSRLMQKIGIPVAKEAENMFFYNTITSVIDQRKKNPGQKRNDLVDMMLEAMHGRSKTNQIEVKKNPECILNFG